MVIKGSISSFRSAEALVRVEDLRLFGGGRLLFEKFDLIIRRGERVGVTGPSGCGKTSLLRAIVGRNLAPGSTAKRFDITPDSIGYVSQGGELLPWYSLDRNIRVMAKRDGRRADWCAEILSEMDLVQAAARFPRELSGGELQRARLAAAVVTRPSLYCADEPLTEVGLSQRWRLLERWSSRMSIGGAGLILVSHDVDTLMYLCDYIIAIRAVNGRPESLHRRVDLEGGAHPRSVADMTSGARSAERQNLLSFVSTIT